MLRAICNGLLATLRLLASSSRKLWLARPGTCGMVDANTGGQTEPAVAESSRESVLGEIIISPTMILSSVGAVRQGKGGSFRNNPSRHGSAISVLTPGRNAAEGDAHQPVTESPHSRFSMQDSRRSSVDESMRQHVYEWDQTIMTGPEADPRPQIRKQPKHKNLNPRTKTPTP